MWHGIFDVRTIEKGNRICNYCIRTKCEIKKSGANVTPLSSLCEYVFCL